MPISLVGTAIKSAGSSTMSVPSGLQEGDVVFVVTADSTGPVPLPTGFTDGQNGHPFSYLYYRWAYRVMGATPITQVEGLSSGDAHLCFAFRGVDVNQIFDVVSPSVATSSNGYPDPPAITTITNGCMIIALGYVDGSPSPLGPSGYAYLGDEYNGNTVMAAYKEQPSAGEENPGTFDIGGNDNVAAATIALRPTPSPIPYALLMHPF